MQFIYLEKNLNNLKRNNMWIRTLNGIEFIQVVQTSQGLYIPKQFKKTK